MFGNDRDSLRRFYQQCWQKAHAKQPLDALEQQIVAVIQEHPEYQPLLQGKQGESALGQEYLPEQGETNPFLHMGLHLGLREQISTNRPDGIATRYQQLLAQMGMHDAEHRMMDCLAESIWLAQRNGTAPDENAYLECLNKLS